MQIVLCKAWRQARDYAIAVEDAGTVGKGPSVRPGSLLMAIGRKRVLLLPFQHKIQLLEAYATRTAGEQCDDGDTSVRSLRSAIVRRALSLRFFEPPTHHGVMKVEVLDESGDKYRPLQNGQQEMLVTCEGQPRVALQCGFQY